MKPFWATLSKTIRAKNAVLDPVSYHGLENSLLEDLETKIQLYNEITIMKLAKWKHKFHQDTTNYMN